MTSYTASQIVAMTTAQLNALAASTFSAFTSADVQALSTSQLNGLSKANFQALKISYLTASQLSGLSSATVANLTTAQMAAFTASALNALASAAWSALSDSQLDAVSTTVLSGISASSVESLTVAQLNGLAKGDFQALNAAFFTPAQIAGLSAANVANLTTAQLAGLTTAQVEAMTTAQVNALTIKELNALPSADLSALSMAQEQALTVSQIAGMSPAAFDSLNIGNLSGSQLAEVTASEMSSLSTAKFDNLAPTLASVNAAAFAGVSLADVESLTLAQIGALSVAQVSALTGAAATYVNFQGVYAELAKVETGGVLMFAGAETLLQAEASGASSAGKFAALTDIAGALNQSGGPSASSMVAQLFDDVVLGSTANAQWTGGSSAPVALGNLSASSSQTRFNELVDKWFLGSDNPTASDFYGSTYQTQSGPLFSGTPTYAQVNQGAVGDCYFESAMAAVADFDPSLLENMITSDGNGVYTVDFYNGTSDPHDYVTVNAQMPVMPSGYHFASGSHLTFDNGGASGAIWSEVMEKAFVEFGEQAGATNDYASISGGWDNGLSAITGQTIQDYTPEGDTSAQLGDLLTTCANAMQAGEAVMMNDNAPSSSLHLAGDHMYNLLSVNVAAGTVTVDNPWNANGFAGGAGETFTDSLSSLASAGCTFHVATGAPRIS